MSERDESQDQPGSMKIDKTKLKEALDRHKKARIERADRTVERLRGIGKAGRALKSGRAG